MAYKNRPDYTRYGADYNASYSRYNRRPGPWQDQYRYYNDQDYAYGRQYYSHPTDYREPYQNHGHASADGYNSYPQPYPYQSYTDGYGSRDGANGGRQAYGEYHRHAASSSRGDDGPSHWAGDEAQGSEPYQESSIYAPEHPHSSTAPGPYYGQTRGYHSHNSRHDSRYDDARNYSNTDQKRPRSRERARSPPPPPPPPPRAPSPAYIDLSEQKPSPLDSPSDARKLLILDLNGTLVFRSAYRPKGKWARTRDDKPGDEPADSRENHANNAHEATPRLRSAHPRPYAPAFRAYLFAPATREWLDVMVWSSAQPHSVRGMVERVFGEDVYAEATGEVRGGERPRLLAIWARDTLGLSESHYRQKVQTIKDLNIVWSRLPKLTRGESPARTSPPPSSSPRSSPAPTHTRSSPLLSPCPPRNPRLHVHSALSTLLLDDSPAKAARQPYNHVCLPEYDARARARDLAVFTREKEAQELAEARRELAEGECSGDVDPGAGGAVDAATGETDAAAAPAEASGEVDAADVADANADDDKDATRKRKRQEKKARKRQEKLAKAAAAPEATQADDDEYDPTLLAVVGVLDAVKRERNVAAWVRAGGLWGPRGAPPSGGAAEGDTADAGGSGSGDAAGAVESDVPVEKDGEGGAGEVEKEAVQEAEGAALEEDGRSADSRKRVRYRGASAAPAGNDDASSVAPLGDEPGAEKKETPQWKAVDRTKAQEEGNGAPLWFEDPAALRYWAERGRRALEELGIPVEHGIER
ncbi:hypothetical protein PsYK624_102650 [Phanerochaete sordida]|uniref:FCP1 homology domain-containing protein n=1 Tax=Phanerochaete sordida TaxID=48140 RepID=A0A9P3GFU0_9APHY|nr:hypothetical protein PsYK624_102650 [Phanerochaete sordida]